MQKRNGFENIAARFLGDNELAAYMGVGRNSARAFAEQCGAVRYIGKRRLNDLRVIDAALDNLSTQCAAETEQ